MKHRMALGNNRQRYMLRQFATNVKTSGACEILSKVGIAKPG